VDRSRQKEFRGCLDEINDCHTSRALLRIMRRGPLRLVDESVSFITALRYVDAADVGRRSVRRLDIHRGIACQLTVFGDKLAHGTCILDGALYTTSHPHLQTR
jgi:hypothetical protein